MSLPHLSKSELLQNIAEAHAELDSLLSILSDEQVNTPGVYGELSVSDVLAHLAGWEKLEIGWLRASYEGREVVRFAPGFELGSGFELDSESPEELTDRINAEFFRQNSSLSLTETMDDLHATQAALVELVGGMSDEDLNDPHRFSWWYGEPIWASIATNSYEHYHEHIGLIRGWLAVEQGL